MNNPASTEDLNYDASGLMQIMQMLAGKSARLMGEDEGGLSKILTDLEISELYENSKLIKKIINKYPEEFYGLGYQIKNSSGELLEENDEYILNAIKDGLITSRLYGRSFLYLVFEDFNPERPLRRGLKLMTHNIVYDIYREGDFYLIESQRVHFTRVIEFIGERTYRKMIKKNDANYCRSILQGIYQSFHNFIENSNNSRYLLNNLSYLTIGIENLGNMQISDQGRQIVFERLSTLNLNRNIGRVMAYDKSKEIIGFISQTLTGVNELIEQAKSILVSESDYPASELFDTTQSQALGSGIQNQLVARYLWARKVRSWAINNALPYLKIYFDRTRDMSNANIFIPFVVDLTDEEKADIEKKAADRSKVLIDAGVVSPEEVRECYRGDEFSLDIILDDSKYTNSKAALPDTEDTLRGNDDASIDVIPDDNYWDELATITTYDLDLFAQEVINDSNT
jgi:hypothetical protein